MIIDGKKIADDLKNSLREEVLKLNKKLCLGIIKVGENIISEKFLELKRKFASDIGISSKTYDFPENISTSELRKQISRIVHTKEISGVIVQLPLPKHINLDYILNALPSRKDPDMLSRKSAGTLPPVVGAINRIFEDYGVWIEGKNVVVLGSGKLVGKPAAEWLMSQEATVCVLNSKSENIDYYLKNADIIISGIGKPRLVKPQMVKDGVVAIDCGTSESEGKLVGDFDLEVANKASIFSPVPGGVGPITIAILFSNLVKLAKK